MSEGFEVKWKTKDLPHSAVGRKNGGYIVQRQ